jgi:predicted phage baseplate assembly protein
VPLEAPQLDNRRFEDLLREAQLRIPRYAPEWSDFNESDPGMTLVQLFAWLTEMMLYQMNRVPERNYIKFLQLLGLELEPAQAATVHLEIQANPTAIEVQSVPPRTQVEGTPPEGDSVTFETLAGLDLIRPPLEALQVFDGAAFSSVTDNNSTQATAFPPFGWQAPVGSALYLGFTPPKDSTTVRQFPQEMRFRVFLPTAGQAGLPASCNELQQAPAPPVTLVWEYQYRPSPEVPSRWRRLNVFKDESVAFTREGYILVEGPKDPEPTVEGKDTAEKRYWLRVRLADGSFPVGRTPEIDFIRPNTIEAENLLTVRDELLGVSTGLPDQIFTLASRPARRDSLQLTTVQRVGSEEEEKPWACVDDFLASGAEDRHFVLNQNKGEIRFGDGSRGLIPPANVDIIARLYRAGGGAAGNVPSATKWTIATSVTGTGDVITERPATGGRDEQKVDELKAIAPRLLRSRDRAITKEDFAVLAASTGEVRKATAIPLAHPDHPGVEVPGAVTLVIVPDADIADLAPKPSADLISRVCQYLDARRPVTTELYVKGPEYKQIKVEARVEANEYAAFDTVKRNIVKAINQYLDPLGRRADSVSGDGDNTNSTAAQSSEGWKFGRELFPTSLFSVIAQVKDVVAVTSLEIRVDGHPHERSDPVTLALDGLLSAAPEHEIVVVPSVDR